MVQRSCSQRLFWAGPQVESLAKPQLRYKVDINAVENHLTGAAIVTDAFCLVVVEGSECPPPASRLPPAAQSLKQS